VAKHINVSTYGAAKKISNASTAAKPVNHVSTSRKGRSTGVEKNQIPRAGGTETNVAKLLKVAESITKSVMEGNSPSDETFNIFGNLLSKIAATSPEKSRNEVVDAVIKLAAAVSTKHADASVLQLISALKQSGPDVLPTLLNAVDSQYVPVSAILAHAVVDDASRGAGVVDNVFCKLMGLISQVNDGDRAKVIENMAVYTNIGTMGESSQTAILNVVRPLPVKDRESVLLKIFDYRGSWRNESTRKLLFDIVFELPEKEKGKVLGRLAESICAMGADARIELLSKLDGMSKNVIVETLKGMIKANVFKNEDLSKFLIQKVRDVMKGLDAEGFLRILESFKGSDVVAFGFDSILAMIDKLNSEGKNNAVSLLGQIALELTAEMQKKFLNFVESRSVDQGVIIEIAGKLGNSDYVDVKKAAHGVLDKLGRLKLKEMYKSLGEGQKNDRIRRALEELENEYRSLIDILANNKTSNIDDHRRNAEMKVNNGLKLLENKKPFPSAEDIENYSKVLAEVKEYYNKCADAMRSGTEILLLKTELLLSGGKDKIDILRKIWSNGIIDSVISALSATAEKNSQRGSGGGFIEIVEAALFFKNLRDVLEGGSSNMSYVDIGFAQIKAINNNLDPSSKNSLFGSENFGTIENECKNKFRYQLEEIKSKMPLTIGSKTVEYDDIAKIVMFIMYVRSKNSLQSFAMNEEYRKLFTKASEDVKFSEFEDDGLEYNGNFKKDFIVFVSEMKAALPMMINAMEDRLKAQTSKNPDSDYLKTDLDSARNLLATLNGLNVNTSLDPSQQPQSVMNTCPLAVLNEAIALQNNVSDIFPVLSKKSINALEITVSVRDEISQNSFDADALRKLKEASEKFSI
jgi:hypothetical protein